MLRPQKPEPVEGIDADKGFAAVMNGLRYVKGKRILQSTYTVDIVAMVFGMPRVLFPVLAVQRFHHGAAVLGWLFAAPAFGALVGALSSGWVGRVRRLGLAILISVLVWGAAIAAFGLVGGNLGLALVFLAIAGGADVISAVFRNTVQQLVVPDGLRGRLGVVEHLGRHRWTASRRPRRRVGRERVHARDLHRVRWPAVRDRRRGDRDGRAAIRAVAHRRSLHDRLLA